VALCENLREADGKILNKSGVKIYPALIEMPWAETIQIATG